jgi:hypothetical protein
MGISWGQANLDKDARAIALAKAALGWDSMTSAQRMDAARALLIVAQGIKGAA